MTEAFNDFVLRPFRIDFKGRARRSEYAIRTLVWGALWVLAQLPIGLLTDINEVGALTLLLAISLLYLAAVLSVTVRRLHDIGWSGACSMLILIPFVGWLFFIPLYLVDSQEGRNKYGAPVKQFQTEEG